MTSECGPRSGTEAQALASCVTSGRFMELLDQVLGTTTAKSSLPVKYPPGLHQKKRETNAPGFFIIALNKIKSIPYILLVSPHRLHLLKKHLLS